MKLFVAFLFVSGVLFSQKNIENIKKEILDEGFKLYESEMASWHGTDLFFQKFQDKAKIGGYVSYTHGNNPKCVFFSNNEAPSVLGTITFDKSFDIALTDLNLTAVLKQLLLSGN